MLFLLVVACTVTAAIFLVAAVGISRLGRLADIASRSTDHPFVSIVLAARDEARHLPVTLEGLLAQKYSPLELIVVNDRSADATGLIADAAARSDARVTVIHVTTLPVGWLGKNHALHVGATWARGELLLFTDGDVRMAADAVAQAVAFIEERRLDHLAVVPGITSPSRAVRWSVGAFSIFFLLFTRAWQVATPKRSAAIGIGAFNMVRARSYRDAGGHEPIRMRPDDDLMIGRLLKRRGGRADLLIGPGIVDVDWYASLGEFVRGVEKNTFAGLGYSIVAAGVSLLTLLLHTSYFVLPFLAATPLRPVVVLDVAILVGAGAVAARAVGQPGWCGLLQPLASLLFAWVQTRATLLTLVRGGIRWRGTFYSLAELRRNRL